MTEEQKIEFAEKLVKSGAKIGNFVMDNHGTMTLSANIGEERNEEAVPVPGTKNSIMEYVNRLMPLVKEDFKKEYDTQDTRYKELQIGVLELMCILTQCKPESGIVDESTVDEPHRSDKADRSQHTYRREVLDGVEAVILQYSEGGRVCQCDSRHIESNAQRV